MNATPQCKNCGADLTGRYCAVCGQHADVRIPSLHKLLVEALGDLYNFDSRLWRSLGFLLLKPGRLTREYLEGRRARYVPPFRLYVVLSLAFFFALAVLPDRDDDGLVVIDRRAENAAPSPAAEGDAAAPAPETEPERSRGFGIEITDPDEGNGGRVTCDFTGTENWNPEIRERLEQGCNRIAADSGGFWRAVVDRIPLMMFLFIPIVAAGMKALYPLARRKYVEHLLFFLHFHAFFFLVATLGLLFSFFATLVPGSEIPVTIAAVAGWTYVPIYLFIAMRRVYAQGRLATAFKYVLLGGGYFFALGFTFVGIILYTALTI